MLIENDDFFGEESQYEGEDVLIASNDNDDLPPDTEIVEGDESDVQMEEPAYEVDIDGTTRNIPLSEMKEMIEAQKKYQQIEPDIQRVNELKPVLEKIGGSQMLKNAITYSMQGYSDDQIVDGLFLLRHPEVKEMYDTYSKNKPQQQEETPAFDTIEEEVEYRVKKGIEAQLAPIKQQLEGMTTQQKQAQQFHQANQVYNNNDALINAVVKEKYGSIDVTPDNIAKLQNAFVSLGFGRTGEDIVRTPLNKDQIEVMLYKAYGNPARQKAAQQYKDTSTLPNIMQGQAGHAPAKSGKQNDSYSNSSQRKRAIDALWDSL